MRGLIKKASVLLPILVLAAGLGGVALAQRSSGTAQVNVTILDSTLRISPKTLAPGTIKLVAVNQGRLSHALAIMGTGLKPKRTPAITSGRSAVLTVTLRVGMYQIWDPVRSSMSHATMLMVKAPKSSSSSGSGATVGGSGSSGGTSGSSGGTSSGGGTSSSGGTMPPMDPNDPCAGM